MKKNSSEAVESIPDLDKNESRKEKTQSDVYFELAQQYATVFHDQYGEPYAMLQDSRNSCVKINSLDFKRWFVSLIRSETGKFLRNDTIASVILMLEGHAIHEAPEHELDVRIVNHDDAIWYDLGNGSAVRIDRSGWEVVYDTPIIVRRLSHQKPQAKPLKGGDIRNLLKFINLPGGDLEMTPNQILILAWLIFAFVPNRPHPVLTLYGAQGSAKTTAFKIFKALIDPSRIETLSISDSQRELAQLAAHHYFVPLDNLTHLAFDYSDMLCRIVTGDGFSKRALYTNDDDVVFAYQRVIGLNGINITADKADLLDRSLLVGFERMKRFGSEKIFWKRFEAAKPQILGAIFDTLVKTLAIVDSMPEPEQMRMADFARYGCAITEALGMKREDFLAAYRANIERQNDEALSASVVGPAIIYLIEHDLNVDSTTGEFTATPTEYLVALTSAAQALGIDCRQKFFPNNPHWAVRRTQEIKTNLERVGIRFLWHYRNNQTITIIRDQGPDDAIKNADSDGDIEPTQQIK